MQNLKTGFKVRRTEATTELIRIGEETPIANWGRRLTDEESQKLLADPYQLWKQMSPK